MNNMVEHCMYVYVMYVCHVEGMYVIYHMREML